MSYFFRCG